MNDDLISRKRAIEAVGYYYIPSEDKMLFADTALRHLPSAPERQMGKWINRHKCSECGYVDVVSPYAHNLDTGEVTLIYKFCPNCGAKMEGEEDETY